MKLPLKQWMIPALCLFLLAGCTSVTPEPGQDALNAEIEAIRKLETDMVAAWAARDTEKVVSFYASDAFVQLANRPVIDQIDAIRREVGEMAKDPSLKLQWSPDTIEVAKSADVAWSRGTYTATVTDPATKQVMTESGRFVNTYRKVNDGTWKLVADVPTPSGPAVPQSKQQ